MKNIENSTAKIIENPTDKQIFEAFKTALASDCIKIHCCNKESVVTVVTISEVYDLLKRQQEEIERLQKKQKPSAASGYKVENGKVVFFTNMLNGYRHEYENLDEVVKTLNVMLNECYIKDEIVDHFNAVVKSLNEDKSALNETITNLLEQIKTLKADFTKEFVEKIKEEIFDEFFREDSQDKFLLTNMLEGLSKEVVGG